jgi:hypothetical protein
MLAEKLSFACVFPQAAHIRYLADALWLERELWGSREL